MVLVLAGGEGRRMGGKKPERKVAGQRLIDLAIERASGWSQDAVAVAGDVPGSLPSSVRCIPDRAGLSGPLAGLAAGLDDAAAQGFSRLLLMPVDTPFLPADLPARLGEALDLHGETACAMAASGGRRHPVCSLWRVAEALAHLSAHLATGDRSLHGFADAVGTVTVEWPSNGEPDPFFNINHPSDLALAERMWALSRETREG